MSIKDWHADERPREKLLRQGAAALSDAELLAIFLRVGVAGQSAVELARALLTQFGSVAGVVQAERAAFCAVHGLGEAKYVQLQATVELARRALASELRAAPVFDSSERTRDYLRLLLGHERVEVFIALWLDARHRLLATQTLFRGTIDRSNVYPREVLHAALAHDAAAVIFAHNHPSGHAQPSGEDLTLTQQLKTALELIDVRLLDHCIVGQPGGDGQAGVYSMADRGQI